MSLTFRNVDARPADDVATWPYEALVAAIDRGLVPDWRPIFAEIRRSPRGETACRVERYLGYREHDGVSTLFRLAIERARDDAGSTDPASPTKAEEGGPWRVPAHRARPRALRRGRGRVGRAGRGGA